ncbi:MAG: NHLP bacteriocin system secretion protein [Pseudomonadota bacterium]
MSKKIFRQAALDRLASPEKLDAPTRLVGSSGWLVLLGFLVSIGFGAYWALVTKAPVHVAAQGILINRGGLVEIIADRTGQLDDLTLVRGQLIEEGAVVARLSQEDLERELKIAEARLTDAEDRFKRFETFYYEQEERETRSDAARRQTIEQTLEVLREREKLLTERVESTASLVERQVVIRDKLLAAQVELNDAQERILTLEEEALSLSLAAQSRISERSISMLDESLAVDERMREIRRLKGQLSEQQVIVSAHTGRIVEVKVNEGDVVQAGTALATLAPSDDVGELEAIFYAAPGDGKLIEQGMEAEISPTAVEREVYGFIPGDVTHVAALPATPEGMRRTLQNDQLVTQLSANGAPIETRVRLMRDPLTPSGFAWSSSDGPFRGVGPGALIEGRVLVDEVPIIDLLLPGASKLLERAVQ